MSTMFSGSGTSAAAAVGSEAAPAQAKAPANAGQPIEGNQQGQQGAKGGESQSPFLKETVKIDGKDVELVFQSKEELLAEIRKAKAADKRFEEAAAIRKQAAKEAEEVKKARREAEEIRQKYGEDTLSAALDAAIESGDPEKVQKARDFMEEKLAGFIRRDMMDPRERELEAERKRANALQKKLDEQQRAREEQEMGVRTDSARKELTQTIISALETQKVPNTDWTASIMARLMKVNMEKGVKLSPEQLAEKSRGVIVNQVGGLLANATGEQIIELFPDIVKKVRAADLKRLKDRQPKVPGQKPLEVKKPVVDPKASGGSYLTPDQWKEKVRQRALASQNGQPVPEF